MFLQDTAYNYPGSLDYPFNAKQVTEIRKDFTENSIINKINVNLLATVDVLQGQNTTKDSLILIQDSQIDLYKEMVDSYKEIITTVEKEKTKLNKDIVKQKRIKYILEGVSAVEAIVILISFL